MSKKPLRVAILGASGIGKNHAGWFQKNGTEVCAFSGTSPESVAHTGEVLRQRLGYVPAGYFDVSQLLQSEKPDAVCIATPPELHFEHVQTCLNHNVPVLCEKPLVYDGALPGEVLIRQADALVQLAREKSLLLGTQMQYCLIAGKLCELSGVIAEDITSFKMEMETKNLKPGRSHETVWIELAPHPLSMLQKIAGVSELQLGSIRCDIGAMETIASFQVQRLEGSTIDAKIIVRCNPEASTPVRRFTLNGVAIDYSGRKNASGDFLTYLASRNETFEMPDLVDMLIANFIAACNGEEKLAVTGADGAQNVAWLVQIMERGKCA